MRLVSLLAVALALSLGGCASYNVHVDPSRDLGAYQRFFVESNLADNHAIDAMLVRALRAHGREAERGPLTMLPASAQALVTYGDRWAWDFKDHMVALRIVVLDARSRQPIGTASFSGPVAMTTDAPEVVERLIRELLSGTPPAQAPRTQ